MSSIYSLGAATANAGVQSLASTVNRTISGGCSPQFKASAVEEMSRIRSAFIRAVADCEVVQKKFSFPPANLLLNKWDPVPKLVIHGVDKNGRIDRDFPMCPDFQVAAIIGMVQEAGIDKGTVKILTANPQLLGIEFDFRTVIAAFKTSADAQKMIDWAREQKAVTMAQIRGQAVADGPRDQAPA